MLIGHGVCHIINETSCHHTKAEIKAIVNRIIDAKIKVDYKEVAQDYHLSFNQKHEIRCGDNGIFKGVPTTKEQELLTAIAQNLYNLYGTDGKYIIDGDDLIICQSNATTTELLSMFSKAKINPLGYWTGGINVDSGATNRKLGSDMGDAVTGGGLCLSGDSEYLGDDLRWHRIDQYVSGKVGQWNNGKLEFVVPNKYISNPTEKLLYIHNDTKLSMCLTPKHEMLIKTSKGNYIKKEAKDICDKLINGIGNSGVIIHNFEYQNKVESKYTDLNDLLLQIAFCADGTILNDSNKKWRGRIRVKKQYKKERLRLLLANKDYLETQDKEYSIFWFKPTFENKSLYECCKNEDLSVVYNEVFNWDGDIKRKLFRTIRKEDADFIQFVIQSQDKTASITYNKEKHFYTVKEYNSNQTHLRVSKGVKIKVEETNGKTYCFNVPSHNLIIRHNNKIFITGNCGKDLSKADVSVNIYAHLKAQKTGKVVNIKCAIGDRFVDGKPYSEIVDIARKYIKSVGGFEKFAEWGLIR